MPATVLVEQGAERFRALFWDKVRRIRMSACYRVWWADWLTNRTGDAARPMVSRGPVAVGMANTATPSCWS